MRGAESETLLREVLELRARVSDLEGAAARHEGGFGISLAEREELLGEAERVIHLGTWVWDLQSDRVYWSDELFRIFGLAPGSIIPSTQAFAERIHPDDLARAEQVMHQAFKDGVFPLLDYRIVCVDGSVREATIYGSCVFDAQGKPRRAVGAVLDRTGSLATEADLRRTLMLLEEAQRLARLGSWRFDPQSGQTEWSLQFRRVAGLPLDTEPNVEAFLQCIHPGDRAQFIARYQQEMANPSGGELDGRLLDPSGEVRHFRLRGELARGANGAPELRGTLQDISDQVRLQEQLAHSRKMEAVGRLAAGIAHDFNNLLTVVGGNLELLSSDVGSCPELEDALRAVESASNLTRRLLAFGRKAQLSLSVVEPNQLVESTLTLMQRLVGDQVQLETELAQGLPLIRVDALEIERALVNLVVNARDVSAPGSTVKLETRASRSADGEWVEITVSDAGPGIKDADLPHIFEPFYTTRAGGTGLGLATVLGTAEQHGGTVRVSTESRVGSRFTIVLPAAKPETQREPASSPSASRPISIRTLEILVIDDEPMVAEATRRLLASRGHRLRVATSASDALGIWAKHGAEIELVICDVVMPQMRGPELITRLAAERLERWSSTPPRVLFMSGYNEEATHAGLGKQVLAKPFTLSALEAAIEAAMTEVLGLTRSASH
ncbi:MAG TPA: ATP-binding protein [Polyangiaceae bacterium]|nr:ATP-binding protein [Polyangiaceae bacterium]